MTAERRLICAIYTRKSTEEGLDQNFNSLDAQRDACENYIASQKSEGWLMARERYDDGGYSGGNMERPGLKKLLDDVRSGMVDIIVVYKIDRLSRSLADFAKLVEIFDEHKVTFVSVTQAFNTTTSMGRLIHLVCHEAVAPDAQSRRIGWVAKCCCTSAQFGGWQPARVTLIVAVARACANSNSICTVSRSSAIFAGEQPASCACRISRDSRPARKQSPAPTVSTTRTSPAS